MVDDDMLNLEPEDFDLFVSRQERYARVVLDMVQQEDADYIWVNDFPLMMLPAMIKRANPNILVGFFLHTGYCECDDPPQPQPPMASFDFSVLPSGQSVLTCPDLSCDLHDVQI